MAATIYPVTLLDADQVVQHVYDESTQTLRTTATATIITPPQIEVLIDHTEDSIRLGDGTNFLTSTTIGADVALDVNVINSSSSTLVTTPNIQNITIAVANTEQSYALPTGTKKVFLKARGNSRIKLSYTLGTSGTNFITISRGGIYTLTELSSSLTLYFQADNAGEIIELESWS